MTIILLSALLLAIVGIGGYWLGAGQQQASPPNLPIIPTPSWLPSGTPVQQLSVTPTITTSRTDVTSNWKTYHQDGLWEIMYPSGWVLTHSLGKDTAAFVGLSDGKDIPRGPDVGYIYIQIAGVPKTNNSYDEILIRQVGSVEKGPILTISTLAKLKLDGYPAIKLLEETSPGASTDYSYQVSVYVQGPFDVRISAMSLRFRDKPMRPDEKFTEVYLPIFDQILSTFKFIR